jgi:hypothetical protein
MSTNIPIPPADPQGGKRLDALISENLSGFAEAVERLIKLLGLAALIFVIAMGLDYKWGSDWGREAGQLVRERAGKPVFKGLPDDDKPTLFWNDDKLIQGGLTGAGTIAILSSYVVFMLLVLPPTRDQLHKSVSILLGFPNSMAAFFVCATMYPLWRDAGGRQRGIVIVSVAAALFTFYLVVRKPPRFLSKQVTILVLQSMLTCYVIGASSGYESTDFEKRYPLVEVQTTDAQIIDGLRMIKTGDTECRFVRADGTEYLIPKTQIRIVRTASATGPAHPLPAPTAPQPAVKKE